VTPKRLLLAATLLLGGCASATREDPFVRTSDEPPPAEPAEVAGPPAEPGLAWVDGRWIRLEGRWEWKSGSFATPPRPDAVWMPGRWVGQEGAWRWVDGEWK
jgi:hypothetical protein